jgi:magnesium transporter
MTTAVERTESALAEAMAAQYPGEVARVLEGVPVRQAAAFLEEQPEAVAAVITGRLTPDTAAPLLPELSGPTLKAIVDRLDWNRVASLLARLDEAGRERCLSALMPEVAKELADAMRYPPDTAGALMNPRALTFHLDSTVREVIRRLRKLQGRRVQDVYMIDDDGKLAGWVPVEDLLWSSRDEQLIALSRGVPPSLPETAARSEILETLETNHVRTIPVLDFEGRIAGILRQEELLEATEEAASADLVTMFGAGKEERALSPPLFAVRMRLPWLEANLLTAFLAASVVGLFEGTIARFTALAVLLPVVAGQSGNTGAQALAVTMRGLSLREVRVRQWLKVTVKEVATGSINGVVVAVTTALAVLVWSRSPGLALVIGVSMVLSMTAAGFAGAIIPMALTRVGQDPAQSSSIILTTVTDVVGFFSFLGIATLLAGML